MTHRQLQLLGMASSWAKMHIDNFDDAQYRLVLRNVGSVEEDATGRISGKNLSNAGFEQVMAWFESIGWAQPGGRSDYWRTKAKRASAGEITEREIRLIESLATQLTRQGDKATRGQGDTNSVSPSPPLPVYPSCFSLEGFIHRMSNHRTTQVENLYAREGYNVIEALKKMVDRNAPDDLFPSAPSEKSAVKRVLTTDDTDHTDKTKTEPKYFIQGNHDQPDPMAGAMTDDVPF